METLHYSAGQFESYKVENKIAYSYLLEFGEIIKIVDVNNIKYNTKMTSNPHSHKVLNLSQFEIPLWWFYLNNNHSLRKLL